MSAHFLGRRPRAGKSVGIRADLVPNSSPSATGCEIPGQVGLARAALAGWLSGCPQADEAILVAAAFAANSVLHSGSRHGGAFTLRAEVGRDFLRIEVGTAAG